MKNILKTALFFFVLNACAQEQFSIYFDTNKFNAKKTETNRLNQWLLANKDAKIIGANGYCDEDGSTTLNDTLSKKRINFVFNLIKNKVKFRQDFKTHSFGKLHQLSQIKAQNRKVTLFYILPKDFDKEEEILGIKKEVVAPTRSENQKPRPIKFKETLTIENPDGSMLSIKVDTIFMQKINLAKVGEKIKIENINFIINTFAIINESRVKLFELLYVLQQNPKLKIEIHGHLCCNPIDKQNLSTQRARAITNFLVNYGIDKTRLTFKGFGGTMPIHKIPEQTPDQAQQNRRVEILIVAN